MFSVYRCLYEWDPNAIRSLCFMGCVVACCLIWNSTNQNVLLQSALCPVLHSSKSPSWKGRSLILLLAFHTKFFISTWKTTMFSDEWVLFARLVFFGALLLTKSLEESSLPLCVENLHMELASSCYVCQSAAAVSFCIDPSVSPTFCCFTSLVLLHANCPVNCWVACQVSLFGRAALQ